MTDSREPLPGQLVDASDVPAAANVPQLYHYYSAKRLAASKFVRALGPLRIDTFTDADITKVHEEMTVLDPVWKKTVALAVSATELRSGVPSACRHWLNTLLDQEFGGNWTESPSVRRVFDRYRKPLTQGDGAAVTRSHNALRVALLLLLREGAIEPNEFVDLVEGIVESRSRKRAAGESELAAVRPFVEAPTILGLRRVYDMCRLWFEQAARARSQIRDAELERDQAERRLLDVQNRLREAENSLSAARAELAGSRAESSDFAERLRVAENARINELHAAKAKMRGFLLNTVRPRLVDADRALGWDPPRVDVVKERIETLLDYIMREDAWLTSD